MIKKHNLTQTKRNACASATIGCGLMALSIRFDGELITWFWHDNIPVAVMLGLITAIFATQWVEYQKRHDAVSSQPGWPSWLRRLLY